MKKHTNNNIKVSAESMEGVTGHDKICKLWHNHFKGLLNSSSGFSKKEQVIHAIENLNNNQLSDSESSSFFLQ